MKRFVKGIFRFFEVYIWKRELMTTYVKLEKKNIFTKMKRSPSTWSNYLKNQNQSKKNLSVTFCWHTFFVKVYKKEKTDFWYKKWQHHFFKEHVLNPTIKMNNTFARFLRFFIYKYNIKDLQTYLQNTNTWFERCTRNSLETFFPKTFTPGN